MNNKLSKFSSGFLVFTMATLAGLSARADDTEIFFGGSGNPGVQPNVLFILDNSGSMDNQDCPSNRSCSNPTRMQRMKTAMNSLLDNLNNVNVGLMQFSFPGGPVLFPVTDIDAPLIKPQSLSISIASASDDAEQSSTGAVTLDNKVLAITKRDSTGTTTISSRITASSDDAEERLATGTIPLPSSASLELAYDDFNVALEQAAGLVFRNQSIPQNARILSANIVFTIQQATGNAMLNDPLNLEITGQMGDSIATFSTSDNVSSRTRTPSSALWSIVGPTPAVGETLTSSDIAAVIQDIVSQPDWASGDDIALFLQRPAGDISTGERIFSSYDDAPARSPQLVITYETRTSETQQTVGLRFADVAIPQGAKITTATLEFQSAASSNGTATYTIYGEKTGHSAEFTNASSNLTGRSDTSATVSWTPTAAGWMAKETHSIAEDGADIKSVIQEIVNQTEWCGGNALSLFIEGTGDARFAHAFEDTTGTPPKLKLSYDPNTIPVGGGCMATSLSYRIDNGNNDARGNTNGSGDDILADNQLPLARSGNADVISGFRFTNLQIPQGTDILSAYLEFTAATDDSSSSNLTLKIQRTDNASSPCSGGRSCEELGDKTYYSTTVAWNAVPAFSTGMTYRTPDISSLLQLVVDRSGWNSGNAMLLAITGSGNRKVVSYNSSASSAPRLILRIAQTSTAVGGTTRDAIKSLVNDMQPITNTPIVDTLYEAALYFRGGNLQWGDRRYHSPFHTYDGWNEWSGFSSTSVKGLRVSHPDSYSGGTVYYPSGCSAANPSSTSCKEEEIQGTPKYISPMTNQCQTNHIVFLTDGAPTGSGSANLVKALIGKSTCADSGDKACGPELAEFLFDSDHSALPGKQNIYTHTVAFNLGDTDFLDDIAEKGGTTEAKSASTASELETVFQNITGGIVESANTTFVSPGVTVNTFNRLTHRNEIYFALFRPESKPSWPGNLKRYTVNTSGQIIDSTGVSAIDETTGFFKDGAKSYWTGSADGNDVTLGGAASQLPASASRNIYTHYSGASSNLANTANAFTTTNSNITKAMLGLADTETDTYRSNLINWARGLNPATNTERKRLADPLHSVPHLVTYGGTDSSPDITIYYGDNEGFLHAINASNGQEVFSFIPGELLPNLKLLYANDPATKHPYGMDGPINSWIKDVDGDSQIESADGDHAYIYASMRRGGRNLYALNVTNRSSPSLLWKIEGGSGSYTELGQTWSKPIKTKVNVNGTVTDVLIMGGGYDPAQDNATTITPDTIGRAIYIINATDGSKVWSVGPVAGNNLVNADMLYSIPSTVRVIDINSDGLADQMYVGDTGGQVWRFDIHNGNNASNLVTGGVIADLSGTTAESARRFYHEADVSLIVEDNKRKLAIVIGSGFHAHPLDETVTDRIYMIKQSDVTSAPEDGNDSGNDPDYVKLTESNLYDATDNLVQEGSTSQQAAALTALKAASGWYITLEDSGEKVLSTPLAVAGDLLFTTYSPTMDVTGCTPTVGTSRLYHVNIMDAGAVNTNRSEVLKTIGIPPDPVRLRIIDEITGEDGSTSKKEGDIVCVGTQCKPLPKRRTLIKTYWYNN